MCSCNLGNHPSTRIDTRQTTASTHRDERGLDHPIQTSDCSFEKDTRKKLVSNGHLINRRLR